MAAKLNINPIDIDSDTPTKIVVKKVIKIILLSFFAMIFVTPVNAMNELEEKVYTKMVYEAAVCTAYFKAMYLTLEQIPDYKEKKRRAFMDA